ncbi:hypothetical protein [Neobacillus endophyticus]|uniref:hypothetical protein n=1 Tax=Neobacillus endophyticus TaxID=2738405 RepID=UPI001C277953|nr:hypothetical protein [Neobacillus endophyticus]
MSRRESLYRKADFVLPPHRIVLALLMHSAPNFLGDPIFDEIFTELNKRKTLVHIHSSSPPASFIRPKYIVSDFMIEFTFNTTRAMTNS